MHLKPTVGISSDYVARVNAAIDALDRRLLQNLVDNGAFQVWQRGSANLAMTAASIFADRWYCSRTVAGATASRQTGTVGKYSLRIQRDNGNAATTVLTVAQNVESINCYGLSGLPVTLKFRGKCGANYSAAGSGLTVQVNSGTGQDQSVLSGLTGQNTFLNATSTLSTVQTIFEYTATVPAGTTQLAISFLFTPVGTAGANDWFEIEEVQLVIGTAAGNFPYRRYSEELAICQRYFWDVLGGDLATANLAIAAVNPSSTTAFAGWVDFPVEMRITAPTLFVSAAASFSLGYPGSIACATLVTSAASTKKRGKFDGTTAGHAATQVYHLFRPGTTATFVFSADL